MKNASEHTQWYETFFGPDYITIDHQENTDKEVSFLCDVMKLGPGVKLLDAACGYGRHLLPLVGRNIDAYGCDLSQALIGEVSKRLGTIRGDSAHGNRQRIVRCDMRSLPFSGVFDCVCLMYTSLGYFDGEDDNFRVLTSIRQAMRDDGLFLLDNVNRDYFVRTFAPKDWITKDDTVIVEERDFDHIRSRSEIDVTVVDKQGKRTYHHSIRLYSFTELSMLLEAAGFEVQEVYGGFGGEVYDWDHSRMIILSRAVI